MGAPDVAAAVTPVAVENKLPPVQTKKGPPSCSLIRMSAVSFSCSQ